MSESPEILNWVAKNVRHAAKPWKQMPNGCQTSTQKILVEYVMQDRQNRINLLSLLKWKSCWNLSKPPDPGLFVAAQGDDRPSLVWLLNHQNLVVYFIKMPKLSRPTDWRRFLVWGCVFHIFSWFKSDFCGVNPMFAGWISGLQQQKIYKDHRKSGI